MHKDRVRQLERKTGKDEKRRVVVCWCPRELPEGQHKPGCPVLELVEGEPVDILEVHYVEWPPDGNKDQD